MVLPLHREFSFIVLVALVLMLVGLQLYQRALLLGFPAGNREETARGDELPLHQCSNLCADDEEGRVRSARPREES